MPSINTLIVWLKTAVTSQGKISTQQMPVWTDSEAEFTPQKRQDSELRIVCSAPAGCVAEKSFAGRNWQGQVLPAGGSTFKLCGTPA